MTDQRDKQLLALQGGMKAVATIQGKGRPKIGIEEFMSLAERFGFSKPTRRKMKALLDKEDIGSGPFLANYYSGLKESKVQAYERTARELFKVPYAIGVSSGTGALHSAFVAAGVGPGTEVICPAIGFFATASAVVMAGGIPVFGDVDASLGLDPKKIESVITKRTVALAPTHVMGSVSDMGAIMKVARKHKLKVVEDCAQSCGATFKGRLVGTIGDLGCFSIACYKIVGGGEGGLVLTKDKRLWDRANQMAEGGGLWRPNRFALPRYEGELFCGTNYRMSELEAAVDVVQLGRMGATVKRFRAVKRQVMKRLKTFRDIVPQTLNDADGEVGYTLRFFPSTVDLAVKIAQALAAEGVSAGTRGPNAGPDWHIYHDMFPLILKRGHTKANCPYDCPIYAKRGGKIRYAKGDCPVADDLYDRMVSVNLNQWYTPADCRHIADGINKVLAAYCKPDSRATPWW